MLAVVRSGTLRRSEWFVLGSSAGRIRALATPDAVGVGAGAGSQIDFAEIAAEGAAEGSNAFALT